MPNVVFVVGLGPGDPRFLTAQAQSALTQAEVLCGYTVYLDLVRPYFPDKLYYSTGMTKDRRPERRCDAGCPAGPRFLCALPL